jgi:hypothetical protein
MGRFLSTIIIIALLVAAAVHGFFYATAGTLDPCEAAVSRIIQQQRAQGNDVVARVGEAFRQQGEELLRTEGIGTCYRSALTGEAPEQLTLKFNLPR